MITDGKMARRQDGKQNLVRRTLVLAFTLAVLPSCRLAALQCPDGAPPPCTRAAVAAPAPGANSVGVMLFANLTRDTAYAYLSDGLASEIATSLARVPRLEVRSPGAVRSAQRGVEPDPRVIGRRLNVRYVVEGDFQRGGDRIRISVRLVGVPSGTQRWSESYTRPVTDLLAVQEEIAGAVATAIAGQLLPQERTVLAARPTRNAEAYDHFLRGNFQLARRTPSGVARAIDEYTAAVRVDPSFAQAHARVALGYALYLDWDWEFPGMPRDSQLAIGTRAADRALALDSSSSDAWMAKGYLLSFRYPRTLDGVLPAMERATTLDPRNAEAWHQYSSWLATVGRLDESLTTSRRALALEPGRAVTFLNTAAALELMGHREAEALVEYDSAVSADPEFYAAYAFRAFLRLRMGDTAGARADAQAALRTSPPSEQYYGLAPLAAVAARSGDSAEARRLTDRMVAPFTTRSTGPLVAQMMAFGLAGVGRQQAAIDMLARGEPRGALLWISMQFPALDALRADPRYQRLLADVRPPAAR
jgi:TolB-like protein/Tfp pilus assembly protein PilF